ncbi:MAG: arylamine N-acetyltransferase [Alphaproteobacteria bacterium]|jgi:N-hydroxyarylamine O-acetyltransferase|nr:arylamine N-acetyltransferase [Alphaproteobacteria bacterium]
MFDFDKQAYLNRIGLDRPVAADVEGLTALHRRQVRTIAFENFDILLGRSIDLAPEALWEKMVEKQRGGYCFELNGLLLMALHAFGFVARPLLARVHAPDRIEPRTHQVNLVTVDGEDWLADAGFGRRNPRAPVRFELGSPQDQDGIFFRLIDGGDYGYVLQSSREGDWQDLYSFGLEQVFPSDIEMGNYFTSTNPESHFVNAGIAAVQHDDGRTALLNFSLRQIRDDQETVTELQPGPAYLQALQDHFGIVIDAPFDKIRPMER